MTPESQAQETLNSAWASGIRYFDTAPWYGNTQSEHRLGYFLRQKPRDAFVISTKVGRVYFRPDDVSAHQHSPWMARWKGGLPFDLRFDYSRDGIQRSYEDSLMRLGLNRVDALVIHDLDPRHRLNDEGVNEGLRQLENGGFEVLADLKARGEIKAIGAGINHIGMIGKFLERFDIDYFLVAMPYTLLDQSALDEEFSLMHERGVSAVIGAVFASGVLATGTTANAQYAYQPLDTAIRNRVDKIKAVCDAHNVPLNAAALQFPLGHPVVTTVIPGANTSAQVESNRAAIDHAIPLEFWNDLKDLDLLRRDAPV